MNLRALSATLLVTGIITCCVLGFYQSTQAAPRQLQQQDIPFPNSGGQRIEILAELKEMVALLKEQNKLLKEQNALMKIGVFKSQSKAQ